jgi:integrase
MGSTATLRSVTTDPDIGGLLRAWDAAMEVQGLSPSTRRNYRYEMLSFYVDFGYAHPQGLATITASDLAAYVVSLPVNGSKRSSAIRALKAFYTWAEGEMRPDNPCVAFRVKRVRPPRAPDLTDEQVHALIRAAFRVSPRRGWALVLCLATGARIGSLVAARPEDIGEGFIWFRVAKGSRPYEVPLSHPGMLAARHLAEMAAPGGTLVGVSAQSFRNWVHQAGRDAGIEQRVWPHLLRHVTITRVARVTDPATVAEIANWADLSQYRRYVSVDAERERAALDRVFG